MIFVTLGTHERPFYRLVKELERLIVERKIKEKVVIQLGFTDYVVKNAQCHRFFPEKRMKQLIRRSSVIITHGGLGSIMLGIEAGKPVIAVPRRKIFGEHTDDHQLQIVKEAKKRGSIFPVFDIKELEKIIRKAKKLKVEKRKYKPAKILKIVATSLKNWAK